MVESWIFFVAEKSLENSVSALAFSRFRCIFLKFFLFSLFCIALSSRSSFLIQSIFFVVSCQRGFIFCTHISSHASVPRLWIIFFFSRYLFRLAFFAVEDWIVSWNGESKNSTLYVTTKLYRQKHTACQTAQQANCQSRVHVHPCLPDCHRLIAGQEYTYTPAAIGIHTLAYQTAIG